jgi:hypothetical protein
VFEWRIFKICKREYYGKHNTIFLCGHCCPNGSRNFSGRILTITTLATPKSLVDAVKLLGSAQAVIIPILFAGLVYLLGTILEALLSSILERVYIHAFGRALRKRYSPLYHYQKQNEVKTDNIRSAKDLSRATHGHLISSPSEYEKQAIPHIVRFHSEAKMCFSSGIVLFGLLVLAIADNYADRQLIINIEGASLWLCIIAVTILALLATSYQRLQSRAWFIARTIERSAAETDSPEFTRALRDELLAFRKSK